MAKKLRCVTCGFVMNDPDIWPCCNCGDNRKLHVEENCETCIWNTDDGRKTTCPVCIKGGTNQAPSKETRDHWVPKYYCCSECKYTSSEEKCGSCIDLRNFFPKEKYTDLIEQAIIEDRERREEMSKNMVKECETCVFDGEPMDSENCKGCSRNGGTEDKWIGRESEEKTCMSCKDFDKLTPVVKKDHPCSNCAHFQKQGSFYPCSECDSDFNKWEKRDEVTDLKSEKIDDSGKRKSYGENLAEREPSSGKGRFDLVTPFAEERIAKWYELGAAKYADRNWERGGIPFSRYLDSAKRHINKFQKGFDDEDHLAAACWNLMCIIHFQEKAKLVNEGKSEWDDLPNYIKEARKEMLDAVDVSSV